MILLLIPCAYAHGQRTKALLDLGWKFHLGDAADPAKDFEFGEGWDLIKGGEASGAADPKFDDRTWRTVDLPHDWAVELPYVQEDDQLHIDHSSKPLGREYPDTSIGWYRRCFFVPVSAQGQRLSIDFEGVFRNCLVWLNGHYLGHHESGTMGFGFDISDYCNYGADNVLVVRVDATRFEGWFYEGAGIYRHVWLVQTSPLHVGKWGTYVTSEVHGETATLTLQTTLQNDSDREETAVLESQVLAPNGERAASNSIRRTIKPWSEQVLTQRVKVSRPFLWSPDTPSLYKLESLVTSPDSQDKYETDFGIRTIHFDPEKGFFLNGRRLEIKGTCDHQDHAGVGVALPDALQVFRVKTLKGLGSNAVRTAHNPPAPEFLDACDRLGMMVVDENRFLGSEPENLEVLREMVLRDRNHPSVILWSIGNEEAEENTQRGARIAETMVRTVHAADPTRPITFAGNNGNHYEGINSTVDVRGWNYVKNGDIDKYHRDHPNQPIVGTETGATYSLRGDYDPKSQVNANAQNGPAWSSTPEQWWNYYLARHFLAGGFIWAGFDYGGVPAPYSWPSVGSYYGILDSCGFMKDSAWYYKAWWTTTPVVHIFPHWNWKGREGKPIDVWCYSNADEVELLLNGKSLGKMVMPPNGHLEWNVWYQPGVLEAVGYRNGVLVARDRQETTGDAASLVLTPDRREIRADGEDAVIFSVSAEDSKARQVPDASNEITFSVTGGRIIGVGNGDPTDQEMGSYVGNEPWRRALFHGQAQVIVRADTEPGSIQLIAKSPGLKSAEAMVDKVPEHRL